MNIENANRIDILIIVNTNIKLHYYKIVNYIVYDKLFSHIYNKKHTVYNFILYVFTVSHVVVNMHYCECTCE